MKHDLPIESTDLDQQIAHVEQRLVTRHRQLSHDLARIEWRARQALSPSRLVAPAVATGVALVALWLTFGSRPAATQQSALRHPPAPRSHPLLTFLAAQLIPLAFTMLPARWRGGSDSA